MPIETFENQTPRVHPRALVHPTAHLIGDVDIGEETYVLPMVVMRGDSGAIRIGARTSIQDGSVLHATTGVSTTSVGAKCTVGHRVILHGCKVGNLCLVGMGSVVMDNAELGDSCFLAAGSLVPPGKVYPPRSFILGSPARRQRDITETEQQVMELSWQSYVALLHRYRAGF